MVEERECKKKFDRITKRKENEGYAEWKDWVVKQIENYDVKNLQNLVKRTEINMKLANEDSNLKAPGLIPQMASIFAVLITAVVTISLTTQGNMFAVYNTQIDKSTVSEYAKLVCDTSIKLGDTITIFCGMSVAMYILLVFFEYFMNNRTLKKKNANKNILRRAFKYIKRRNG